jgi:hypothetical protein
LNTLDFDALPAAWVLGLVLLPGVAALAWWAYRVHRDAGARRHVAWALRGLLLALTLLLAFGPHWRRDETRSEKAPLAFLLDDSASMRTEDEGAPGSRLERVRALLAGGFAATLDERYELDGWRFGATLGATAADGSTLTGAGEATALGDALLAYLREYRGRAVPDLVLFGDGRSNAGAELAEATERLRAEGIRVHAVLAGNAEEAPDLALERIQAPDQLLSGDVGLFSLRLRAAGEGVPPRLRVRLLDEGGETLDEAEVDAPGADGAPLTLSARLEGDGTRRLVAELAPAPGETALQNNRVVFAVDLRRVKIRALYVEGRARWEYTFLQRRLARADADVTLQCWLADASPGFVQEHSADSSPLLRLPVEADRLLEDYDVVIFGEAEPNRLTGDPADGARFLDALAEFVRRGGGLLLLAGPRHNPHALVGSALEPMLPVILSRARGSAAAAFRPLPPDPLRPHPVVTLETDPDANRKLWENATPLQWFQPVERLRPGAAAWLVHDTLGNEHGPWVLAASIFAPEGWIGWIGTDETWRWRFPGGETYLERFWRAALRHVAATRLRGEQGRARLDVDPSTVEVGGFVRVEARLLDEAYQPLAVEHVTVLVEGRDEPLLLAPDAGRAGVYGGRIRAAQPGLVLLALPNPDGPDAEPLATARFEVVLPSREMARTTPDLAALRALAERTGGSFTLLDDAGALLASLDGSERVERVLASRSEPLDPRWLLAALLLLACGEWILRKTMNLS